MFIWLIQPKAKIASQIIHSVINRSYCSTHAWESTFPFNCGHPSFAHIWWNSLNTYLCMNMLVSLHVTGQQKPERVQGLLNVNQRDIFPVSAASWRLEEWLHAEHQSFTLLSLRKEEGHSSSSPLSDKRGKELRQGENGSPKKEMRVGQQLIFIDVLTGIEVHRKLQKGLGTPWRIQLPGPEWQKGCRILDRETQFYGHHGGVSFF